MQKAMPHIIAQYSYELTKEFSEFYSKVRTLSETDPNMRKAYLKIVHEYSLIIEKCFSIL
jgi:arginyl-tRNA synthetase